MKKEGLRSHCPINFALEIFGDKWSLLVMRDLIFKGKSSYGEFLEGEEGISTNILANRLGLLEQHGLITKHLNEANRTKYVYGLTPKGRDLTPLLVEVILWSAKHDPETAAEMGFVQEALSDRDGLVRRIMGS